MELFRTPSVIHSAMPNKRFAVLLAFALIALPSFAAVTGTVLTPDGKPVAGARVATYAGETQAARLGRLVAGEPEPEPLATTETDAKGAFSLESPKAATAELRLFLRGWQPLSRRIERDEESLALVVQPGEAHVATITSGGKPVANATVAIHYGSALQIAKTDADGRYEVVSPKHATRVTVVHPDHAIDDESFFRSNEAGIRAKLSRSLKRAKPVTGKVVASDGKTPVAGARIMIDEWPLGVSGEDGTFRIERAPVKWKAIVAQKETQIAFRPAPKDDASLTLKLDPAAVFTGRVVDGKTKLPVNGAAVRIGTRGFGFGPAAAAYESETDAKGTFAIHAPAGVYTVTVDHPGYDGDGAEMSASAGQQSSREFALQPLARITGMIVDEANRPVAAARVTPSSSGDPFSMRGSRFMMRDSASTHSGADGRFLLRANGERELRIQASRTGLPTGRTDMFRVAAGERKSNVVITLPAGVEVTGVVTDADGNPLSGATIMAGETAGRAGSSMQRVVMIAGGPNSTDDAVRSASDGTFAMRLQEGAFDFTVRRDGYAQKVVRAHTVSAAGTTPLEITLDPAVEITGRVVRNGAGVEGVNVFAPVAAESSIVTGPDGSFTMAGLSPGTVPAFFAKEDEFIREQRMLTAPSRDVVIELPAGGRVSGRVIEKGSRRPITSFQAGISRPRGGGPMMMTGPPQTRPFSSDDGSFVLDNVPSGSMTVVANAPGYVEGRVNVTIEEGKPIDDLVVELEAGVKLTGRVTGPTGTPLSDVRVQVGEGPALPFMGGSNRAITDANGEYSIEGLAAGEEKVQFTHDRYVPQSKQVTLKGREARADAQLEGGQRVTGSVVTDSGSPVADAYVTASSPSGGQSVATNANGQFEFESLAPGRYRFTAGRAGYMSGSVDDVDISSGTPVRVVLKTGGTLYGRVTGLAPHELADVIVTARAGSATSQTPVDASGNYRLEGAPVGSVTVSAMVRAIGTMKSTAAQTVNVDAGSAMQVDLTFATDVVVRGRVTRNGTPLSGGSILFMPRSTASGASSSAAIDANGNYSISGLVDGHYGVTVIDQQRMSPYTTEHEVRGSGTFDIDYTVGSIRGRVFDAANNRPLSGVNVSVRGTSAFDRFSGRGAVSDEQGVFVVDSVPTGSYTLTASINGYGTETRDVTVGTSALDDVELRLTASDGLVLKVVDARDGRALAANGILFDAQGRMMNDARPIFFGGDRAAGDTRLAAAPGSYVVTVWATNYAPVHVQVTAPSTRTVALTPGGRIEIDSNHDAPRRFQLVDSLGLVYPRTGPLPRIQDLLPRGTTPIERVAPGRYTLQLLGPDDVTVVHQVPVVVNEGQTTRAEL